MCVCFIGIIYFNMRTLYALHAGGIPACMIIYFCVLPRHMKSHFSREYVVIFIENIIKRKYEELFNSINNKGFT